MPDGMAAISNPTVTALPCKECAYGAASPSGTMYKLASQPNSIRVSSLRSPKTIRNPSADTARKEGRAASRLGNGRGLTPATT